MKIKTNKRQAIRKAITFISFILYPITMYYFSPYIIILAVLKGYASASLIVFLILFIFSLFLGRVWCGWLCPASGVQIPLIDMGIITKPVKKGTWIKFLIWGPWVLSILFIIYMIGGLKEINIFFGMKNGISIDASWKYIIYYTVISLIIGLNFIFGKRAFCKYVCWMSPFMIIGRKIRNIFKFPSLGLKVNKSKCKDCLTCNKLCPMSIDINKQIHKNNMENYECTLCGSCVDYCPNKVISYSFEKYKF